MGEPEEESMKTIQEEYKFLLERIQNALIHQTTTINASFALPLKDVGSGNWSTCLRIEMERPLICGFFQETI